MTLKIRRIISTQSLLDCLEEARHAHGMTMEDANERVGVADRYWPKVVAGRESAKRRDLRRKMKGHKPPKQTTVRYIDTVWGCLR